MARRNWPEWLVHLDDAEVELVKRLVLASGSLKELAAEYRVSYPTIRARLDRVIDRIERFDSRTGLDAFEAKVRSMVAGDELDPRTARELMDLHRERGQVRT
jgi:hypothetical protein